MKWTGWAAGAALSASVLGVVMGDFERPIEQVAQEIDAITLAGWIRNRTPHLLVSAVEEPLIAIPGSVSVPEALELLARGDAPDVIVVYEFEHLEHWRQLQRFDTRLHFLRQGAQQWFDQILAPTVNRDAAADTLARFETQAELSRYFGGVPRMVDSKSLEPTGASEIRAAQRRGCGF